MNRFEQLRYERGETQREVAVGAGVSVSTIIRLERSRSKPNAAVAKALADYFGVQVTDLMPLDEGDESRAA